jgi:hypothetical protein
MLDIVNCILGFGRSPDTIHYDVGVIQALIGKKIRALHRTHFESCPYSFEQTFAEALVPQSTRVMSIIRRRSSNLAVVSFMTSHAAQLQKKENLKNYSRKPSYTTFRINHQGICTITTAGVNQSPPFQLFLSLVHGTRNQNIKLNSNSNEYDPL